MNIVFYNIVPKPENNYSLLISKTIINISKKRTQTIANYIKPIKSSKFKRNNIN